MARVAVATCARHPRADVEQQLTLEALEAIGVDATTEVWTDPAVAWERYELVIVRTTWDYTEDRGAFVEWAQGIERIENPASVLAWNTDKRYLEDLARQGIPVVETTYVEPGHELVSPAFDRYVIKPTVGAGARGVERFERGDEALASAHVAELSRLGLVAMVQPYLELVDVAAEIGIIVIDGRVSHAIEKRPILSAARQDRIALLDSSAVVRRIPTNDELRVAHDALDAARACCGVAAPFLYARVDLLQGPDGPVVLELEATEPSLYLALDEDAAGRLAAAVVARL